MVGCPDYGRISGETAFRGDSGQGTGIRPGDTGVEKEPVFILEKHVRFGGA